MAEKEESTPAPRLTDLPNEILLNIGRNLINPELEALVYQQRHSCYRVTDIDAPLGELRTRLLDELRPFMKCKNMKLWSVAKDVIFRRTTPRVLEAAYLLDRFGQSIFRIRGTLVDHPFCHKNAVKLHLVMDYTVLPQDGPIVEEPDYLLEKLEEILMKYTALQKIVVEFHSAPDWFCDNTIRMLDRVAEKIKTRGGADAVVTRVDSPYASSGTALEDPWI